MGLDWIGLDDVGCIDLDQDKNILIKNCNHKTWFQSRFDNVDKIPLGWLGCIIPTLFTVSSRKATFHRLHSTARSMWITRESWLRSADGSPFGQSFFPQLRLSIAGICFACICLELSVTRAFWLFSLCRSPCLCGCGRTCRSTLPLKDLRPDPFGILVSVDLHAWSQKQQHGVWRAVPWVSCTSALVPACPFKPGSLCAACCNISKVLITHTHRRRCPNGNSPIASRVSSANHETHSSQGAWKCRCTTQKAKIFAWPRFGWWWSSSW